MRKITTSPTILIVDDEPTNISLLGNALSDTYNLSVANSGEEALRIIEKGTLPDLILMDVMMKEMNGFEVCQKLKSRKDTAGIPVIFVTSLDDTINEEVGFKAGAVDYIYKPISPPIVRARVKVHLEHTLYREYLELLLNQRSSELESMERETQELSEILGRLGSD